MLPLPCISYPDGLIFNSMYYNMLLPDEVLAVCAHEFSHIVKKHVRTRFPRTVLPALIVAVLVGFLIAFNSFLISGIPLLSFVDKGFSVLLISLFSFLLVLFACFHLNAKWLRQQETECDLNALDYGYGEAMKSALAKLRPRKISGWASIISKLMPQTHPTLEQRIQDIQTALENKTNSNPKPL